jgi:protein-disulfide isomerase
MLFGDLHCAFTLHLVKTLLGWLDEQPAAFRLVWRHRPIDIHPGAVQAAQIAERLALRRGERSFWRFVFALSEFQGTASESELSELEQALKTRTLLMNESLATSRAAARLERDRLIALGYEIHATPTLFINGLRIEGEISRPHMEQLVNEEKEQVEALLDESVPRAKTYSVRVDANLLDWERE